MLTTVELEGEDAVPGECFGASGASGAGVALAGSAVVVGWTIGVVAGWTG